MMVSKTHTKTPLTQTTHLFRFSNWWHYKAPILIGVYFCGEILAQQHSQVTITTKLFLLTGWIIATAAFGYFLNDWTDIKEDSLAGKHNEVGGLSNFTRWIVIVVLASISLLIQVHLNGYRSIPFALSVIQLLLFVIYSVPPVRLKQFLVTGVLCDSLYAHVMPAAIVFFTAIRQLEHYELATTLLLAWMTVLGLKNILLHHVHDRKKDSRSNATNAANKFGALNTVKNVNRILLPADLLMSLLFMATVNIWLPFFMFVVVSFRYFIIRVVWRNKSLTTSKTFAYMISNNIYEGYFPLLALAFLFSNTPMFLMVYSFVYLLIFPKFTKSVWHDLQSLYRYF